MENHERVERKPLKQCGQVATLVECFAWLQRCDECIERLKELCRAKRPRLTVEHRQSVVTRIARLTDAKEIVLERVRDAVERHGNAKINTAFNGEFATNNNVVAQTITFYDYTQYLNEKIKMTRRQSCIRSKLHEVYRVRRQNPDKLYIFF
ncbi:hypothetical protein ALC56_03937 [Trachymyrmex septentrionalis]|uniref:Uncharacterized protein n=1 Tax=Trachymyrmex septentrionalis TaxID=34720 RepID=A0A151JZR2_9HYME|nr:hypothetical protein ALC56_03937 [Trachymyrmex septentrionalis]